jgi:ferritin-like metal-binding protein YciE
MKMKTLHDLFVHELKDLYSAEKQITKALPKMIKAASSGDLHEALQSHFSETEQQVHRLEEICKRLDIPTRGTKCAAMEGLIEEGHQTLEHDMEDHVRDAAIICCAQRIEHYEMAGYGCARTFAEQLGHGDIAEILQRTLDEEKAADERLTQLAMQHINEEAAVGGD